MKNAKSVFFVVTVSLMMVFLTSCFTIHEVKQPAVVGAESSFDVVLKMSTNAEDTNPKYGILGLLIPNDWTVDNVVFEGDYAGVGEFLHPDSADGNPGGAVDYWEPAIESQYPSGADMQWVVYQADTAYTAGTDTAFFDVHVTFTTSATLGDYNLSYLITNAGLDFTDPTYWDTSMVNPVTVTNITPIADVQDTTGSGSDASALVGEVVTITGTISAESYAFGDNYYWIQDAKAPWSGIKVYDPDRGTVYGDSVMITGTVKEYWGVTEIDPVSSYTILATGKEVEQMLVTTGEIGTGGANAEAYEGCLVKVEDVAITNSDAGYGQWLVSDGSGDVMIDDAADYYFEPADNDSAKAITGVLEYSYGDHKIQPRLAYDIVDAGGYTRFQAIQQVRHSDLLKAFEDEISDVSYFADPDNPNSMAGDTVKVKGIVTMPTGLSYAGAGIKFIFGDPKGGPWSAILSYNSDSTLYPTLFEGDLIEATGYIGEYTTAVANMTELWIIDEINILSIGEPAPPVDTVATGDLRLPATAEQWGNVIVAVKDAKVTDLMEGGYELFEIDDGTGGVLVDDDSDSLGGYVDPPLGSLFESAKGWVYHHYGAYSDSTAYKLCPLYVEDLVLGAGPPMLTNVSRDPGAPKSSDDVGVKVEVTTNGTIATAEVYYSVDGAAFQTTAMTTTDDFVYTGTIPAQAEGSWVEYFIKVEDTEAQFTLMPADTSIRKYGYVVKDGVMSIADVQYSPWEIADSPFNGYEVSVSGIVTGDTAMLGNYGAYAIQDAEAQWSGIFLFGVDETLIRGDEVKVWGVVEEQNPDWTFKWGNNTMILVDSIEVLSQGNAEPTPLILNTGDIPSTDIASEPYEGVLVRVENAQVSAINSYDWSLDDGSGACLVDDDASNLAWFDTLSIGTVLDGVTGVFTYSFGTYKIEVRDMADVGPTVGIADEIITTPLTYKLKQNFPNPFNPETRIYFEIPEEQHVQIVIYDILGYRVRALVNQPYSAGQYVLNWDGRNQMGQQVSSGTYILRMKAGNFVDFKKMTLIR